MGDGNMTIRGKVAVITASASGIGKVTALRFAREGAKLVICDINDDELKKTEAEIAALGSEVLALHCDMGELEDIDNLFEETIKRFKSIDILVNNAGIAGPTKPITEVEPEEWDNTLKVNLRATYYCIKKAVPYMIKQGGGKIVNLSSQSGKKALPNRSPYCASKMGVIGLTRCVADELGKHNITVNAVCPGPVSGKRLDLVFENLAKAEGISIEKVKHDFLAQAPLKRAVPPEDIAEMILLLSDNEKSNSITGQDINVNCGIIMY